VSGIGLERGERAVVTGASSGIGEVFARALAARGVDLLLTALPQEVERLDAIARELSDRHGVRCTTVGADLSERDGPAAVHAAAEAHGFVPDLLVNNAGVGSAGPFASAPLDGEVRMVHVNVEAVVRLTGLFLPAMVERRSGAVLNVASTAAFQPLPYFAVYAASKAFVLSFSQALWAEARTSGVLVSAVCSGPVETAFHAGAPQQTGAKGFLKRRYMTPERVVETAIATLQRGRPTAVMRMPVVGLLYYPVSAVRSFIPLERRLRLSARLNRWVYDAREEASSTSRSDTVQSRSATVASRLSGDDVATELPEKYAPDVPATSADDASRTIGSAPSSGPMESER
jgi:short-subunit dehydrogenase